MGQIDWRPLTHCLTLMPSPTWAFSLFRAAQGEEDWIFLEKKQITAHVYDLGVILTERELFPRVRRESESKDGHRCDEEAGHDQVEEVVEGPPPDPHHKGDVQVRFGTAVVDHFVPGSRHACEKHIHNSSDALRISRITASASTLSVTKNGI